jgi:hypothetical protein
VARRDWEEEMAGRRRAAEGLSARAREGRARPAAGRTGSLVKRSSPSTRVSQRYRRLGNDAGSFHHGETIFFSLFPISSK